MTDAFCKRNEAMDWDTDFENRTLIMALYLVGERSGCGSLCIIMVQAIRRKSIF
jgi:hypothetical protein